MGNRNLSRLQMLLFSALMAVFLLVAGCKNNPGISLYHRFADHTWNRFNILSFELPVADPEEYDVSLFAVFTENYHSDSLVFNMFMRTPAGEERIRDFNMTVRSSSGAFAIRCAADSCTGTVMLNRELNLSGPGILKIEIENLSSKMRTEGVRGVGIRLTPSGK